MPRTIRVPLLQGSEEWLSWRTGGIGGSEAATVDKRNPWMSPLQLWALKTGRVPPIQTTPAMQRGHDLEPIARVEYEVYTGNVVRPDCFIHGEYDFMRASLDGITADGKLLVEIKAPGYRAHSEALRGNVPHYYWPQVQHQLAVTGAEVAHYWSYKPETGGVLIEVLPDFEYISHLIEVEREFWNCVVTDTPPESAVWVGEEEGVVSVETRTDAAWIEAAQAYTQARRAVETAKVEEERLRKILEDLARTSSTERIVGGGVSVLRTKRAGSVDYRRIPQLYGVDLNQYRRPEVEYLKINAFGEDE
jgi:putative phage-type endonuclease